MKGGHTPIHIQRWAPMDYHEDEHVRVLKARRDYLTLTFYRHFIDKSFLSGGSLPAALETLSAAVEMRPRDVERALEFCLDRLVFRDGDRLYQRRVTREVNEELEYRGGRVRAGQESAKKRWGSEATVEGSRAQRLAAARKKGTHTEDEWQALLNFTGRRCLACLTPEQDLEGGVLTRDHISMVSKGGSDGIENIQPLCRNCNTRNSRHQTDLRLLIPGFIDWFARTMPNKCLTRMPNLPPPPPPPLPAPAPTPSADATAYGADAAVPIEPRCPRYDDGRHREGVTLQREKGRYRDSATGGKGWVCLRRDGGCGAVWDRTEPLIVQQLSDRVRSSLYRELEAEEEAEKNRTNSRVRQSESEGQPFFERRTELAQEFLAWWALNPSAGEMAGKNGLVGLAFGTWAESKGIPGWVRTVILGEAESIQKREPLDLVDLGEPAPAEEAQPLPETDPERPSKA